MPRICYIRQKGTIFTKISIMRVQAMRVVVMRKAMMTMTIKTSVMSQWKMPVVML